MTEKFDRLLSEREDLLDQLKKQESVMQAFRRSLEQIKIQNAQYLKTVNMLQKEIKGWFTNVHTSIYFLLNLSKFCLLYVLIKTTVQSKRLDCLKWL